MTDVQQHSPVSSSPTTATFDAIVVGAGMAGLYMLHRLRNLGLSVRVYEAGDGVGGTWYWNRYPGARCDVESVEYSYSFSPELEQEWEWSERYPSQPEILRYLNHVADRFDMRRDIQLNTRVNAAHFDAATNRWVVQTSTGEQVSARFCIMATGCLSTPNRPNFKGLDSFKGSWYHTGMWPHEGVDFTGQRVGVIGTGSSAIQSIPVIAEQASQLYVFQRTPNYSLPAQNRQLTVEEQREVKANYATIRHKARTSGFGLAADPGNLSALEESEEERRRTYQSYWDRGGLSMIQAYNDLILNKESNDTAAEFVRERIREMVHDPQVAELLTPKDYPIATKRVCIDTGYFQTFNRPNVTLVDVRSDPIEEITPTGLRTGQAAYELDSIVFATGFDAMTGTLVNIDIRGSSGEALKETWAGGPRTYLGLMSAGFPNLFLITGPGSPSVLSNMAVSIEQHVDWVADCVAYLRNHDYSRIEATPEAEANWVAHVNEMGNYTLYPQANSWYMGANIPGKPRVFLPYIGGVGNYRATCDEVVAKGYEGFALSA